MASAAAAALRVVTWNVWFADFRMEQRARGALRHARSADVNVIAFQEVTPRCFQILTTDEWLMTRFTLSASSPAAVAPYGCLLAIRNDLAPRFSQDALPTRMGRSLVRADVTLPHSHARVRIGTVHLESLDSRPVREQQLAVIARALEGAPSILVGDFNFCSRREWSRAHRRDADGVPELVRHWEKHGGPVPAATGLENDVLAKLLPEHVDVWTELMPAGDCGFTYDTVRNTMLAGQHKYERMRYDRVLTSKLHGAGLRPQAIELLGVEPMQGEAGEDAAAAEHPPRGGPSYHVSDHFGLLATFAAAD